MERPAPLIAVCANQAWNLVNFREGLIRSLLDSGYRVLAVAPSDAPMEARLADMGCSFVAVDIDAMGLSPWRDLRCFMALMRVLRRHRPAAWLSWTIKPNVYGSLAAAMQGIPAFPNVSGLGTAFIRRNLLTNLVKGLYRFGFRRARVVFFQNEDDRDVFVAQKLVRPGQARLLPGSGIDLAHFAPPVGGRPPRRQFLMIARVVADKGVREYVEAARVLRSRFSDARFRLLGFLDVANRTAISADEVRGWEQEGLIEYLAPVDDVRPFVAEADFVVLPSYREGLSRVLLEAAAMGRPIVTTDVPGCRDIVTDDSNGYLCAARDAASLAAAMQRAAETDDAAWHRLADAGRSRIVEGFSQTKVTSIYHSILAEAGVVAPCGRGLSNTASIF